MPLIILKTTHDPAPIPDPDPVFDARLKRWEKFIDLPSMLPNMRVWKFDTDAQGAFKIRFSN